MAPATSRIKTTTDNQYRRFWPDAGCKGALDGTLERTGCGGVSGIFTSMLFYFRQSWQFASRHKIKRLKGNVN
jgi:hypothetical protein